MIKVYRSEDLGLSVGILLCDKGVGILLQRKIKKLMGMCKWRGPLL